MLHATAIVLTFLMSGSAQPDLMKAGEGIGGVDVGIRKKPAARATARQMTGKDGSFEFANLTAGTYVITIGTPASNDQTAKSFFESRSNLRVAIAIRNPDRTSSDPLVIHLVLNDGVLASATRHHEMSKSVIQNIKARQSKDKPNEVTIEITGGQVIAGRVSIVNGRRVS